MSVSLSSLFLLPCAGPTPEERAEMEQKAREERVRQYDIYFHQGTSLLAIIPCMYCDVLERYILCKYVCTCSVELNSIFTPPGHLVHCMILLCLQIKRETAEREEMERQEAAERAQRAERESEWVWVINITSKVV